LFIPLSRSRKILLSGASKSTHKFKNKLCVLPAQELVAVDASFLAHLTYCM
jgi:hypothetical protein